MHNLSFEFSAVRDHFIPSADAAERPLGYGTSVQILAKMTREDGKGQRGSLIFLTCMFPFMYSSLASETSPSSDQLSTGRPSSPCSNLLSVSGEEIQSYLSQQIGVTKSYHHSSIGCHPGGHQGRMQVVPPRGGVCHCCMH